MTPAPSSVHSDPSPPSPVRGIPVPQQVRDLIVRRILDGDYPAGERLVETRLARELQVSQGSVREALRQLEAGGLIEFTPNRGVTVRKATRSEYAEVALVRAVLEGAAAELAATRAIPTAPLKEQLAAMQEAVQDSDLRSWVAAAVQFHRLIVEGSGNSVLLATWEGLNIEARTIQVALHPEVEIADQDAAHAAIVAALDAGDAARAGSLSRAHEESFAPTFGEEFRTATPSP